VSSVCRLANQDLTFSRDSDVILTLTIAPSTTVKTEDSPDPLFFLMAPSRSDDSGGCASLAIPRPHLMMADFDILAVIGRGVLGKVMLVEWCETNEWFAIKSVYKEVLLAYMTSLPSGTSSCL
jgi:hypothetical protein